MRLLEKAFSRDCNGSVRTCEGRNEVELTSHFFPFERPDLSIYPSRYSWNHTNPGLLFIYFSLRSTLGIRGEPVPAPSYVCFICFIYNDWASQSTASGLWKAGNKDRWGSVPAVSYYCGVRVFGWSLPRFGRRKSRRVLVDVVPHGRLVG